MNKRMVIIATVFGSFVWIFGVLYVVATLITPGQSGVRLACQATNGQLFYDGLADSVSADSGVVSFVPAVGPQAGIKINTTFPCTWAKLK